VKFLCDRCKTRYSIGDDRVRGKILKIRCKNCGNVITVREGMTADAEASQPAAPEYAVRTKKPTMAAPTALSEASEPARAAKETGPNEPVPGGEPARGDRVRTPGSEPPAGAGSPRMGVGQPGAGEPAGPAGPAGPGRPAGPGGPGASPAAGPAKDRPGAGPLGAAQVRRSGPSDPAGRQPAAGRQGAGLASPRREPNALNAAFASAMAKPPPALEEEWYVSIDGDQAGPFSLAEAQGWVGQKALDAELHCWSEGFDDWLPVDKVSHFRGLRKRPAAPTAPPPLPRVGGLAPRAPAPVAAPADDDSKPLFAATMASLERGAPAASNRGLPPLRATPPQGTGLPARNPPGSPLPNGARAPGALGEPDRRDDNGVKTTPMTPALARPADARRAVAKPAAGPSVPARPGGVGNPFDTSEPSESGEAQTQIEAMPFADSIQPRRPTPPVGTVEQAPSSSDAALTTPHLPAAATLQGTGANAVKTLSAVHAATSVVDDGDDLAIGEVSRVVKLTDIAGAPRPAERSGAIRRAGTVPGAVGRLTGQQPSLRSTASIASVLPGPNQDLLALEPPDGDPSLTMAPVRKSHRRGLIALLSVAGVLVLGVVGAVILLVTTNDDSTGGSLGPVRDIDTSRPEDPITHRPIEPTGPVGSANPPPNPFIPRPTPHPRPIPPVGSNRDPDPPPGNSLRSEEIEEIARKHQDLTQRCYMRSQRGVDAILVGEVKKIAVTLVIDKDGNVGDVQLSDHAADALGKCLTTSIRSTWKFRPSSGGTFRFSLNFVGS
jgi:predicted Zn finger-like uncharacterized protein